MTWMLPHRIRSTRRSRKRSCVISFPSCDPPPSAPPQGGGRREESPPFPIPTLGRREEFADNIEKQDAVARRLEIIGESVKRLPEDLREQHPDVPWREIAAARDVLVHEYFRIDVDLAWEMVKQDVPELAVRIRSILGAL